MKITHSYITNGSQKKSNGKPKHSEVNGKKGTTYQNLYAVVTELRWTCVTVNVYIKKEGRFQVNN